MSSTKFDLFPMCLFYLFQLFGVSPISFCSEFTTPFTTSRLGLLYNLLLACPVIGLSYFSLQFAFSDDFAGRSVFEKTVDTVQTVFATFTALFVLAVFCTFQKKVVEIGNRLYALYKLSTCLTYKMDHDINTGPSSLRNNVKRIIIVSSVLSVSWFITIFFNTDLVLLHFLIMTLDNFIVLSMLLQYSLVLKLLHYLYRWVNADLIALLKSANISSFQMTMTKLSQLREIHLSLCHVSQEVSCFYALPMLICIINLFLALIIYSYYVMRTIVIWSTVLPLATILHCVMLVVVNLVMMMILARAAGVTVRESKVTGEIVSESIATCRNERVAKQLKEFSIYLLHKDVNFCVFHLFPLNETLVVSVMSSVTTYLVILLQFKENSKS